MTSPEKGTPASDLNITDAAGKNFILPCPDARIGNLRVTTVNTTALMYAFEVRNIGGQNLSLNDFYFQSSLSTDDFHDASDLVIETGNLEASILEPGQTFISKRTAPLSGSSNLFNRLIVELAYIGERTECVQNNNIAIAPISVFDIPRNGLVAFYPFSGNANDFSGNNLHGTPSSGTSLAADRYDTPNRAYAFNGINNFISVGNPVQLQIQNAITLSVWLKSPSFRFSSLLSKAPNSHNSGGYELDLTQTGDGAKFFGAFIYPVGSLQGNNFASGIPYSANEWVHFTFTLEGKNAKWYRNGALTFVINNSHQPLVGSSLGNLVIGGGRDFFQGLLDDVAVYNRALSPSEVTQLYNQRITKE
jgi:hypothetical protein